MLDSIGKHAVISKKLSPTANPTILFVANTSDDVYIDEDGNVLSDFLPTVKSNNMKMPLEMDENATIQISSSLLSLLLNTSS